MNVCKMKKKLFHFNQDLLRPIHFNNNQVIFQIRNKMNNYTQKKLVVCTLNLKIILKKVFKHNNLKMTLLNSYKMFFILTPKNLLLIPIYKMNFQNLINLKITKYYQRRKFIIKKTFHKMLIFQELWILVKKM